MSNAPVWGLEDALRELDAMTPRLWLAAIVLFGLGDLATTTLGLSTGALVEGGPLAAPGLERFGLGALVALKVAAFAACYVIWRRAGGLIAVCVPLWLASFGLVLTGWNASLLLLVA